MIIGASFLSLALPVIAHATATGCSPASSRWTVLSIRERQPGELPFEEASRYLWPSPDANYVPGPDSLVARVRIDEEHRAHVELEDLRTRIALPLLDAYASLPQWSPDGRYISCVVWKSTRQPHELAVVDVATRSLLLDPDVEASGTMIKWSPDSSMLAVAGVMYARPQTMLYTVSVPEARITILDTLAVLADYEFSWSPNGRWIAFSKPTALDHLSEDPIAADLWVAETATGMTWPLLSTPEWVESNPLWITDDMIQVERARRDGTELGLEQCVVLDLHLADSPRPSRRHPKM
jgi:Tol biopolymer transport system component